MPTAYPSSLDSYTTKLDGVSDVLAADINNLQDAVVALQTRVGVSASGAVVNTTATQTIGGGKTFTSLVTGRTSGNTDGLYAFYSASTGGAFANMWSRRGPYTSFINHTGSSFSPTVSVVYEYTGGYSGVYSLGHLATGAANPGNFAIHHLNSSGAASRTWLFDGATGDFSASGAVKVGATGVVFPDGTTQSTAAIGQGQSWQNVSGGRALNTTYTNSTGRPIQVTCTVRAQNGNGASAVVDGVTLLSSYTVDCCGVPQISYFPFSFIVPAGSTYRINGGSDFSAWAELR